MPKDNYRIFLGLYEIAGHYHNLRKGFESLGYRVDYIDLGEHKFQYTNQKNKFISEKLCVLCQRKYGQYSKKQFLRKLFYYAAASLFRVLLFIRLLFRNDVFIYGFASTFFNYYELPILKLFGKTIIYRFHGADSRPPYLSGGYIQKYAVSSELIEATYKQKRKLKRIEKFADYIINSPTQSQFHERAVIRGNCIGLPFSAEEDDAVIDNEITEQNSEVIILHSPSNPAVKGTEIIEQVIDELKNAGHKIKFVKIFNKTHSQVIDNIKICDFVIDQVYSDTPLAGFPTEAAFYGKPAVVTGYYASKIVNEIPPECIPPSCYSVPKQLYSLIERMIVDVEYRKNIGQQAQEFVRNNWSPKAVAQNYLKLIEGNYPRKWLIYPSDITYYEGAGIDSDDIKNVIDKIIRNYGINALNLNDKPELLDRIIKFIQKK